MKLTPFGEAARILRMKCDMPLKALAEAMGISSAHLSAIEYGEKRLNEKHIKLVLDFFKERVTSEQLRDLRSAAEKSMDLVNTTDLAPDARGLVAAFARRLQQGEPPTEEIMQWINEQAKGDKT